MNMRKSTKIIVTFALMTGIVSVTAASYAGNVYAGARDRSLEAAAEINEVTDKSVQTAGTGNGSPDERIYCVGSVSKVYVTAAVMQLVDQGLVELDKPITTYIPDFTMADGRYKDITVRMLMNHTSGIMGSTLRNEFLFGDNDKDKYDYLLENLKTQTLKADPGAYAAYCNDGFTLLEIIVERVSGMDFTSYIEENIAAPLNLTQTGTANASNIGKFVFSPNASSFSFLSILRTSRRIRQITNSR
jgi:CubicO group peptidase (beta-lactamase class C family)